MSSNDLREALDSVVRAHGILSQFYTEVGAFFRILDELVHPQSGELQLEPIRESYVVSDNPTKLADASRWAPIYLGRFYRNAAAHRDEDSEEADPATFEKLAHAFVWVSVLPMELHPEAVLPECVAGVAHPGQRGKALHVWDASRNGTWYSLPSDVLTTDAWCEGTFPEMTGKFGNGTYWWSRRFPLVDLQTRAEIDAKIATPLLKQFAEKFSAPETSKLMAP